MTLYDWLRAATVVIAVVSITWSVVTIRYSMRTRAMVRRQVAEGRQSDDLLMEWFKWWMESDEQPAKLPDGLHVRTAVFLQVTAGADIAEVMDKVSAWEV